MEYDHKRRMDVMMDGKVYMDFYMASNGSCSLVTWSVLQKPPLGGRPNTKPGKPQHSERSRPLVYYIFIMCEDPHEWKLIEIAFS
jgi:hypothetical protein